VDKLISSVLMANAVFIEGFLSLVMDLSHPFDKHFTDMIMLLMRQMLPHFRAFFIIKNHS